MSSNDEEINEERYRCLALKFLSAKKTSKRLTQKEFCAKRKCNPTLLRRAVADWRKKRFAATEDELLYWGDEGQALTEVYELLEQLATEHNVLPQDIWMVDRVFVSFDRGNIVVLSASQMVNKIMSHPIFPFTYAVNALGEVGSVMIPYSDTFSTSEAIVTDYPFEVLMCDKYGKSLAKNSLSLYLERFINGLRRKQTEDNEPERPMIVMKDTRSPLPDIDLLLRLNVMEVHVLQAVCHLTYLLQPGDMSVERFVKVNLERELEKDERNGQSVRRDHVIRCFLSALADPLIKSSICSAWNSTGMWPIDAKKGLVLLKRREELRPKTLSDMSLSDILKLSAGPSRPS